MNKIYAALKIKWLDVVVSADYDPYDRIFDNIKGYIYSGNSGILEGNKKYMSRKLMDRYDDRIISALSKQVVENDFEGYCMTF